jgi:xyloglucan-specific exo-beta-1,4-glucanase
MKRLTFNQMINQYRRWIVLITLLTTVILGLAFYQILSEISSEDAQASSFSDLSFNYQQVNIQGMGFLNGIEQNPNYPDEIYIRTDVGGAYRLNPDGNSWTPLTDWIKPDSTGILPDSIPSSRATGDLAVDPNASGIIYLTLGNDKPYNDQKDEPDDYTPDGTMWKSTDKGDNWTQIDITAPNGKNVRVHGNVKDNGNQRILDGKLAVDPNDSNVLYYNTMWDGIFKSSDAGDTWQRVYIANDVDTIYDQDFQGGSLVIDATTGGNGSPSTTIYAWKRNKGMLRSTDAGSSWSVMDDFNRGSFSNKTLTRDMQIAPSGNIFATFYGEGNATNDNRLWKYIKADDTWNDIIIEDPNKSVASVSFDLNNENEIWVQHNTAKVYELTNFYKSEDGGQTWSKKPAVVGPNTPDYYQADTFYTENPGQPIESNQMAHRYCANQMIVDVSDSNIGWCIDGYGVYRMDLDYSDDQIEIDAVMKGVEELITNDILVTENGNMVFTTWDMGGFLIKDPDTPPLRENQITYDRRYTRPNEPERHISRFGRLNSLAIVPGDSRVIYAAGDDNLGDLWLWKSTDSGQSWEVVSEVGKNSPNDPSVLAPTIVVSPKDPNYLVMKYAKFGGIWKNLAMAYSTDGGLTWTQTDIPHGLHHTISGLSTNHHTTKDIIFDADGQTIYSYECAGVTSDAASLYPGYMWVEAIRRSDDAGKTLTMAPSNGLDQSGEFNCKNTPVMSPGIDPGELWHGNKDGGRLHYSSDRAENFSVITDVENHISHTLGAPYPGRSNQSFYLHGQIDGEYGLFLSPDLTQIVDSNPDGAGATWYKISDARGLSDRGEMAADPVSFGRVYKTSPSRGVFYAEYEALGLGGYIWEDENNNGIFDEDTSNGINNVSVEVYLDANNDNQPDSTDPIRVLKTYDDDDGNPGFYHFYGAEENQNYVIRIPSSEFEAGGALEGKFSSNDNLSNLTDPDNDISNVDDGRYIVDQNHIQTQSVTLTFDAEPTNDVKNNTNHDTHTNFGIDFGIADELIKDDVVITPPPDTIDTSDCANPDRPCILLEAFDINADGDYYFTPNKGNTPLYREDVPLELFVRDQNLAQCRNASNVLIAMRARRISQSQDDSAWVDITRANTAADSLIEGVLPLSLRSPGLTARDASEWMFEITLECDGKYYRAEPTYAFALGAIGLVEVTGVVID